MWSIAVGIFSGCCLLLAGAGRVEVDVRGNVTAEDRGDLLMWITVADDQVRSDGRVIEAWSNKFSEVDLQELVVKPKISNDVDMDPCKAG